MEGIRTLVVLVSLAAISGGSEAQDAEEEAIRGVRRASNAAIAERDLAALDATWLADLHVTASVGLAIQGGEEMARLFSQDFEDPEFVTYVRTPASVVVSQGGGFAAEEGRWVGTWRKPDGEMNVRGTYFAQWQKRDGVWRIRAEVFVALTCSGSRACAERR